MPSPFPALLHNATLNFTRVTTGGVDEFGNPVQSGAETITVTAFLKTKRDPRYGSQQGVDLSQTYLEGYAVNPMTLPAWVKPGVACTGTIEGLGSGRFYLQGSAQVAKELLESIAGAKLVGYFEAQS